MQITCKVTPPAGYEMLEARVFREVGMFGHCLAAKWSTPVGIKYTHGLLRDRFQLDDPAFWEDLIKQLQAAVE